MAELFCVSSMATPAEVEELASGFLFDSNAASAETFPTRLSAAGCGNEAVRALFETGVACSRLVLACLACAFAGAALTVAVDVRGTAGEACEGTAGVAATLVCGRLRLLAVNSPPFEGSVFVALAAGCGAAGVTGPVATAVGLA